MKRELTVENCTQFSTFLKLHASFTFFSIFKDEIIELLEDEIIGRYYYQTGRIEHALVDDTFILEAVKILNDPTRYKQILNIQN